MVQNKYGYFALVTTSKNTISPKSIELNAHHNQNPPHNHERLNTNEAATKITNSADFQGYDEKKFRLVDIVNFNIGSSALKKSAIKRGAIPLSDIS